MKLEETQKITLQLEESDYSRKVVSPRHGRWIFRVLGKTFIAWTFISVALIASLTMKESHDLNHLNGSYVGYLSNSPFEKSIQTNDLKTFEQMVLKNKSLVNKNTSLGISPIALAVIYNNPEMVKFLLLQGANTHSPILFEDFNFGINSVEKLSLLQLSTHTMARNNNSFESKKILIDAGAVDYKENNYQFVINTLQYPVWQKYWFEKFKSTNQLNVLEHLIQRPELGLDSVVADINTIDTLSNHTYTVNKTK